jgi:hypothetical protein
VAKITIATEAASFTRRHGSWLEVASSPERATSRLDLEEADARAEDSFDILRHHPSALALRQSTRVE